MCSLFKLKSNKVEVFSFTLCKIRIEILRACPKFNSQNDLFTSTHQDSYVLLGLESLTDSLQLALFLIEML